MKTLFDLTYVNPASFSGIAVYALRLLRGIDQLNSGLSPVLLVTQKNCDYFADKFPSFSAIRLQIKEGRIFEKLHAINGYIYKRDLNRIIADNGIDVLFTPYLHMGALFSTDIPQVGVLHDTQSFDLLKGQWVKRCVYRVFTQAAIKRMSHVVVISEHSKISAVKMVPLLNSMPVTTIYNSVEVSSPLGSSLFSKLSPYILVVNTLMPYKNLETLLRAFAILKSRITHNLVIKAAKLVYWEATMVPLIEKLEITDRVYLIPENFSESRLASLYSEAAIFVSPSKMEGFGYSPIEAAIHEIPVVCSKEGALYETTRGLLNYYSPVDDAEQLAGKIENILLKKTCTEKLRKISREYMDVYSPIKQAQELRAVLEKTIKKTS
ncbi:MAG: glycosyltransferase [Halioglobus sp.]